jgi:hypothetical protein
MSKLLSATVAEPNELSGPSARRFFFIGALFLLTIATVLRVYHVGVRSLWFDEALTANISRGGLTDVEQSFGIGKGARVTTNISGGTLAGVLEATQLLSSAPVIHPYILYLMQKAGGGPVAVRAPSVLASLLAVLMMLAMVRVKVSHIAALLSAAILTVSASQIRYAQEVREYSLSVLFAAILIFCFLRRESTGSQSGHPAMLYAALFLAPFVQYGLVLFAFGILSTIGLLLLFNRQTCFKLSHALIACVFLGAGALSSFFLTLRYQLGQRQVQSYLAANYFDPKTMSLLGFLSTNSRGLLSFLMPGRVIALCFAIGAVIFCIGQARARKHEPLTLLVFTSVLIAICASVAGVYPYGGIRQCLFLAPVLTLFAGVVFADLLRRLGGFWRPVVTLGLLALILLSGYRGTLRQWPYGEVEDIRSVLKELARSSASNDQVYIYFGAVPAVSFYLHGKDRRFVYGRYHRDAPQEYVPELFTSIERHTDRIWLVFSHTYNPEEQLIVDSLRPGWDVQRVVAATGAALYGANRKTSPVQPLAQPQDRRGSHATQSVPLSF